MREINMPGMNALFEDMFRDDPEVPSPSFINLPFPSSGQPSTQGPSSLLPQPGAWHWNNVTAGKSRFLCFWVCVFGKVNYFCTAFPDRSKYAPPTPDGC